MTYVKEAAPGASTPTTLVQYGYDVLSRRVANSLGNGDWTTFGYDAYGGINAISHGFNGVAPADRIDLTYTRDYLERRTNDAVSVSTYVWHPPVAGTTTTTPNASNQYTSINGQTLSYDPNGNLTADPTAPLGAATNGFDQKNRLTSATNAQHSAGHTYDPFDRRAGKTVDGVGTVFVMDGDREIADYDNAGHELTRFVYGADAAPLVEEPTNATGTPSDTWYHHTDALGTTLAITDHTGHLSHAYSASPWGELGGGTPGTPFRYAGMRLDPETMLHYDHARYYSAQQGRFISPDPIGLQGGVNIYAYTGNDPLNGVDLSGLDDNSASGGGIAGFFDMLFDSIGSFFDNFFSNPNAGSTTNTLNGTSRGRGYTITITDYASPPEVTTQAPPSQSDVPTAGGGEAPPTPTINLGPVPPTSGLRCFLTCVIDRDPLNLPGRAGLTGLGLTVPKSMVGEPRGFAGSSPLTTGLSKMATTMFGKNSTGTTGAAMRGIGRFYSPMTLFYVEYMAGVEAGCAIRCIAAQ